MRIGPGVTAVALAAVLQSAAAFAQSCKVCAISMPLPICDEATIDHPPPGAIGVVGTVARIEHERCVMAMDVKRASLSSLPARITIDMSCVLWGGKPGDVIATMVRETPLGGAYLAHACN